MSRSGGRRGKEGGGVTNKVATFEPVLALQGSPVSSTAFGGVVVCATKKFGWIICSRSIYFILGQPLFMFFSCLTQKKIYFLRMGGWPSLKTECRRQKWNSDMESGIIYCFWWCSCLCHKRILMDYLFQIHIFHPGSTTIQCFLVVSHKKIYI